MDGFQNQLTQIRNLLLECRLIGTRDRLEVCGLACCFLLGVLVAWLGMQYQGTPEIRSPLAHARHLAAETLAQGKISMPATPGSTYLQTYLTLQSPTYAAAMPLGESVPIALGYRAGDPLMGLWLVSGTLCFCVAWMIRGFASLRWAMIGGGFTAIWMCAFSYWIQSYEGYPATACGIALMWGAARRYKSNPARRQALLVGVGFGWVGFCMPVALLFSAPLPIWLWFGTWRKHRRPLVDCGILMLGLLLFCALQAHVNKSVTGSYTKTPASAYAEKYDTNPFFFWELKRPSPDFDFFRMEQYDLLITEPRSMLQTPAAKTWGTRMIDSLLLFAGAPVLLLSCAASLVGITRWGRWMLAGIIVSLSATILILPFSPAYAAALACLAPLFLVWSLRRLTCSRRSRETGLRTASILGAIIFIAAWSRGIALKTIPDVVRHGAYQKELSEYLLNEEGGTHVVVVNYDINVNPHVEYVYNTANPEKQPIIWARWNEKINDSGFLNHFQDRKMWILWVTQERMPELRRFQWNKTPPQAPVK